MNPSSADSDFGEGWSSHSPSQEVDRLVKTAAELFRVWSVEMWPNATIGKGPGEKPVKPQHRDDPSDRYIRDAEKKLESLSHNIEELRSRPLTRPDIEVSDWELTIADFKDGLGRLRSQLVDLKRGGEKQWSEMQAGAELQMWNLRAAVERAMDESRPLLARDAEDVPLYFIQKSEQGRWGLQRQGAASVVKYFDNKKDAVQFGRRYASRKSPSTLIVRRRDGTFESVQSYP